jgi:hypothetical protein
VSQVGGRGRVFLSSALWGAGIGMTTATSLALINMWLRPQAAPDIIGMIFGAVLITTVFAACIGLAVARLRTTSDACRKAIHRSARKAALSVCPLAILVAAALFNSLDHWNIGQGTLPFSLAVAFVLLVVTLGWVIGLCLAAAEAEEEERHTRLQAGQGRSVAPGHAPTASLPSSRDDTIRPFGDFTEGAGDGHGLPQG